MHQLEGRIAVVSGAASGIGRALATRFATEGMRVVLADIEAGALDEAAGEASERGAEVLAVPTDVASRRSVDALAAATIDRFGVPHVVCNNAGVSGTFGPLWETTDNDWDWVLGVNLKGVVHGIQAFVPAMIEAGHEGHVVNTSSVLGLSTGAGSIYAVTKHAVTRLTEGLWHDLRSAGSSISASVLCPGLIATRIVTAGRNRPDHLRNELNEAEVSEIDQRMRAAEQFFLESGMPPAEVAAMVVEAIGEDRFYILTHPEMILDQVRTRMEAILEGAPPPPEDPGDTLLSRALPRAGLTAEHDSGRGTLVTTSEPGETMAEQNQAEGRVQIESDVVFGTGGGRDLRCDIYTPPNEPSNAPGVILVHGGAWRQGDRTQLRGYGVLLGRMGYVCIAPEYRLTPESPWPAQIHDVKAAIRWVRANAERLGIDPDRIAIEGNSAGAHLALLAAGTPGVDELEGEGGTPGVSTEVAAAVGIYTPTLFSHGPREPGAVPLMALSDADDAEVARRASPVTHITADFPPTMLIHGTDDTTVPPRASLLMYEALVDAGVPVELHMYAEQQHAFDATPAFGRQCAAEMELFLSRYLAVRASA